MFSSIREQLRDPLKASLLVILLLAFLARLAVLLTGATEEDAYITLRYAANIAHGLGFVYNAGEPVLGVTTPLYTLWLALLLHLHMNGLLGGKLLGIGCDLLTCIGVYNLACAWKRQGVGLAAALAVALFPLNLTWAAKGMEVGPVAAAVVWSFAFQALGREMAAWLCVALLVLLRVDGAVLALFLLGDALVRQKRLPWRGLLLFLGLLLPWFVYSTLTFGSPLPTSVSAKLIVYSRESGGRFPELMPFLKLQLFHPFEGFMSLGVLLAVGRTLLKWLPETPTSLAQPVALASLLWMGVYYATMALSPVFLFGWYFVPPSPILYLWGFMGWAQSTQRWVGRLFTQSAPLLVSIAGLVLALISLPQTVLSLKKAQAVEQKLRIPIGFWLRAHASPNQTVLLEPIGYIGYFSGVRVLDTVGLVSPQVLPYYAARYPSPLHAIWAHFHPDFVLLRAGERESLFRYEATLPASQRLAAHYTLVHLWRDPAHPLAAPAFFLYERHESLPLNGKVK